MLLKNGNNFESSNLQFYLSFPKYFKPEEYDIYSFVTNSFFDVELCSSKNYM